MKAAGEGDAVTEGGAIDHDAVREAIAGAPEGERWEAFYDDGLHVGALYRRFDGSTLLTRICFPIGAEEFYRAESLVTFSGAVWESMRFRQEPGGVDTAGSRSVLGHGSSSLPGYAEYLLLCQVATSPGTAIGYHQVADDDPAAPARLARLQAGAAQALEIPGAGALEADVVEIVADGRVVSTHWVAGGLLCGSDWNGARSFPVATAHEALGGVADAVADFIRRGPGG